MPGAGSTLRDDARDRYGVRLECASARFAFTEACARQFKCHVRSSLREFHSAILNQVSSPIATKLSLRVAGRLDEVARVNGAVEQFWERHKLPEDAKFDVLLCLEEILSNVIRHGQSRAAKRFIRVDTRVARDEVEIQVSDDGIEFDPLSYPPPGFDLPLAQRKRGGLGVHLVRSLMDRIHYERSGKRNVFTMARKLRRRNPQQRPQGAL